MPSRGPYVSPVARFEPRLEQETRNRFVTVMLPDVKPRALIVSAPVFARLVSPAQAFAIG